MALKLKTNWQLLLFAVARLDSVVRRLPFPSLLAYPSPSLDARVVVIMSNPFPAALCPVAQLEKIMATERGGQRGVDDLWRSQILDASPFLLVFQVTRFILLPLPLLPNPTTSISAFYFSSSWFCSFKIFFSLPPFPSTFFFPTSCQCVCAMVPDLEIQLPPSED